MPLLVGTWSPRLAAFAGTAATELKAGGSANPRSCRCCASGSAPTASASCSAPSPSSTRTATAPARPHGARWRCTSTSSARSIRPRRLEPELLERIGALVAAGRHDDAGALLSDDVLARFAFAGTPAEVAAQAEAVLDAGALRVDFGTPHGIDERHGVELLCREVLPAA